MVFTVHLTVVVSQNLMVLHHNIYNFLRIKLSKVQQNIMLENYNI